jgi:hypothetical protein
MSFQRWAWLVALLPAAVIVFGISDAVHEHYENSKSVLIAIFGMLTIVFSFLSPYYYKWRFRKLGQRMYKKSPDMHGESLLELRPEAVRMKTAKASGDRPWNSFVKVVETPRLVLLFVNETSAHIIPKRAFKNEAEIAEFIEMFNKGIAGAVVNIG